jgi:hypothetical protein
MITENKATSTENQSYNYSSPTFYYCLKMKKERKEDQNPFGLLSKLPSLSNAKPLLNDKTEHYNHSHTSTFKRFTLPNPKGQPNPSSFSLPSLRQKSKKLKTRP